MLNAAGDKSFVDDLVASGYCKCESSLCCYEALRFIPCFYDLFFFVFQNNFRIWCSDRLWFFIPSYTSSSLQNKNPYAFLKCCGSLGIADANHAADLLELQKFYLWVEKTLLVTFLKYCGSLGKMGKCCAIKLPASVGIVIKKGYREKLQKSKIWELGKIWQIVSNLSSEWQIRVWKI